MKALVLSGGAGTRLRPLTHTTAKQLIPIANKPIIFYGIEQMVSAGIKEFGIVVGDTAPVVMKEIGDGSRWGVKIEYIQQDAPLGLAHAVKISQDFIKDEPFIMFLGDNLLKEGIPEFAQKFNNNKPNALILLTKVPNPQQFGVAELDGKDNIIRLVEKPKQPKSDLALVGVYLFDKNIFKAVNSIRPSGRGELEITDAIQWLLDNGYKVEHHLVTGWWKDTGKPSDLLEANQLILQMLEKGVVEGKVDGRSKMNGPVSVGKGSEITDSVIEGPVVIGENTVISGSTVGKYTSVSSNVRILSSEIEYSIVMDDVEIDSVPGRIDESIFGRGVRIGRCERGKGAHRFIVGDKSDIIL